MVNLGRNEVETSIQGRVANIPLVDSNLVDPITNDCS